MTWSINGRQITTSNGSIVTFDFDIKEVTEIGDVLIVIINVPPKHVMTENVFGVSADGKLLWQIERAAANSTDSANSYIGITGHDENIARIYNWSGTNSGVDVHTGKVFDIQIAK